MTRPQSQRRPSAASSSTIAIPSRNASTKNQPHTLSMGTFNPDHRIRRRRKSSNVRSIANSAEARATVLASSHKSGVDVLGPQDSNAMEVMPGPFNNIEEQNPNSFQIQQPFSVRGDPQQYAVTEGLIPTEVASKIPKPRASRASEGTHLTKGERKRSSGELKCDTCGKEYKHLASFHKHR